MRKYIRSKVNGMIFDWNESLAKNPNAEVISENEAYPERFVPDTFKGYAPKVEIKIPEEIITPPNEAPLALREEATRRFSKPKTNKISASSADISGLVKGDF